MVNQTALSQDYFPVSGKVIHSKTKVAIPLATITVKNQPVGTVTNLDGAFTIFLPESLRTDSLLVSHVGFSTFKIAIPDITDQTSLLVGLEDRIIVLTEVEVNAEQLTALEIMKRAIERLKDNFNSKPFVLKGFFRDVREQNGKTAYLVEASVDMQDPGYSSSKHRPKKIFLKGVRASDSRIHEMLSGSLLNTGNALIVNLEHNFWLSWLTGNINKHDFHIDDIISKDGKFLYVISVQETPSKPSLAEQFSDMRYVLTHKYYVDTETLSIHKVEHLESPMEGNYIAIERPYEGDSLFYSKKGWNQVIEFEEYDGKMYLQYQDVSYTFDIVNQKRERVYLDMAYQFTFVVTDIETDHNSKPDGKKMVAKRSLLLQSDPYDPAFWNELSNAKLSPLTEKQLQDLSQQRELKEQFESNKKRIK